MIKYLAISLFLICSTQMTAQSYYSKYQLKFDIATNSGTSLILYRDISAFYFELDSIDNQQYLINSFATYDQTIDSLTFFKNSIEYFYCLGTTECPDSEKQSVLALLDKVVIEISEIKRIEVLEAKRVSIFEDISTPLQISDTVWMKKPPIQVESFYTSFCFHEICIYSKSQQLDNLISQLEVVQAEIKVLIDEDQINYDNDQIYNDKLRDIIDQINRDYKVVVISGCTD